MTDTSTHTRAPKLCRHGGHNIDEAAGYVAFYPADSTDTVEPDEYACREHDEERRVAEYTKTQVLRTSLISRAVLDQDDRRRALGLPRMEYNPAIKLWFDDFCDDLECVNDAAKVWEREVWFGGEHPERDPRRVEPYSENQPETLAYRRNKHGSPRAELLPVGSLQAFVVPAEYKGYKAEVEDRTYLSYTMCGRSIFQIDRADGTFVSIILDEDSPEARGGVRSIDATAEQAIVLIKQAIADWKGGRIHLVHSDGVGF